MRILFFSSYGDLYGANRSLLSIAIHLKDRGHQVFVFLPRKGEMVVSLQKAGIEVIYFPFYAGFLYYKLLLKHLLVPLLFLWDVLVFPMILRKSYQVKPDVVYSNSSLENMGLFVARVLRKKHIFHIREFMLADYNARFLFGEQLKKKFINLSDGIIFVSKAVRDSAHLSSSQKPTSVIYNGIQLPNSLPWKEFVNFKSLNFGLVGIFDEAKGHNIAVEYFSRILVAFPDSKLHFFGDKDSKYKNKVLQLIEEKGISKSVVFHGFVSESAQIYQVLDVLFMFSRAEGFGRVTIEAMCHGVPVVGFDNAGTSEILSDRISGCLFSNFNSFEESLLFLTESQENYFRIRENAFSELKKRFDEKMYVSKVEQFIKSVL